MSGLTPMTADHSRERRARRWVSGCSAGCFGSILLLVLLSMAVYYYVMSPMPIAAPQIFLTQQTTACVFAHVEPNDPVMLATARAVLKELAPHLQGAREDTAQQMSASLTDLSPLQCVMTLGSSDEGMTHAGLALSLGHRARLINFRIRHLDETPAGKLDGADVVEFGPGRQMTILANNYMFSGDQGLLKTWIERLKTDSARQKKAAGGVEGSVSVSAAFKRAYSRLDTSLPLVFVCTNGNGELAALFGMLGDETASDFARQTGLTSDSVLSVSGQVKPIGPGRAEVTFLVDCGGRAGALAMRDRLEAGVAGVGKRWPLVTTSLSVQPPGVVVVKGRIDDLPGQVAAFVGAVVRHFRGAEGDAPHQRDRVPADGPTMSV